MNKKLVMALIAAGAVSTSTFAFNTQNVGNQERGNSTNARQNYGQMKKQDNQNNNKQGVKGNYSNFAVKHFDKAGFELGERMYNSDAFKALSEEIQAKVKEIVANYESQFENIQETFTTATEPAKTAMQEEMKTLRENMNAEVSTLVAGTDYAQYVGNMFEQNKEDMEEMKAMMEKVKTAYEALPEDMKTQVDAIKEEYKVDFRGNFEKGTRPTQEEMQTKMKEMKANMEEMYSKIAEVTAGTDFATASAEMKTAMEAKQAVMEEMKTTRENAKTAYEALDEETQTKVEEVRKNYQAKFKAVQETFKTATESARTTMQEEMKTLRENMNTEIKEATAGTDFATAMVKAQNNKQYNEENNSSRRSQEAVKKQFDGVKKETVKSYKTLIKSKFASKLDTFDKVKLESIKTKIETAVEQLQNNEMDEEKRASIVSALQALYEVVDEKVSVVETTSDNAIEVLNQVMSE